MNTSEIGKVPIVILGNKIDIKDALSEDDLRVALGLANKTQFGI